MFDFFKRKKKNTPPADAAVTPDNAVENTVATDVDIPQAAVSEMSAEIVGSIDAIDSGKAVTEQTTADETFITGVNTTEAITTGINSAADETSAPIPVAENVAAVETVITGTVTTETVITETAASDVPEPQKRVEEQKKPGLFARIRAGLSRTRSSLTDGLANLLLGKKVIDDDLLEELETQLIMADVGAEATNDIMQRLTERVGRKELGDSDALYNALIEELKQALQSVQQPLVLPKDKKPYVILMVGINGVGKTTTIGKLARQFQLQGKSVMLAAGDTFRAAAVEQLQVWGERNKVPVIAQHTGADSASVLFDALQAAKSRGADVLIADTAGRLHTKDNLMQELEKVVRVMKKLDPEAPHEVMLVLDAGTGQNAINQARQFQQVVGVTGLTLTKLDGTAKGGVIFALAKQFGLPVRYIGVGEGIEDLRPFNADEFIRALFQRENSGD
jgi:fused signal recognition particle receptor